MAFWEKRLPEQYSFGAIGGPMFSTEVNETVGGQRYVNGNWLYPLHKFDVSSGVKATGDLRPFKAFFYNVGGRRDGFRFKDWGDFEATNQPLVLLSGSIYQMVVNYTFGDRTFSRPIYKPVAGAVVKRNGSAISPTIVTTNGQVTVTGHTGGDVYTWTGEFDIPVAFTSDMCEVRIVNKNQSDGLLMEWPSIQVKEFRL